MPEEQDIAEVIPAMENIRGISTVVIIPPLLQHLQSSQQNDATAELVSRLVLTQLRLPHMMSLRRLEPMKQQKLRFELLN